MSRPITGPTFTCVRCLEPETVVLRNALNMCFDCLYPKCIICEQKHSTTVTCEEQRRNDAYRRVAGRKRPVDYRPRVYQQPVPTARVRTMPKGAKRRRPILSHIMQLAEARKARKQDG